MKRERQGSGYNGHCQASKLVSFTDPTPQGKEEEDLVTLDQSARPYLQEVSTSLCQSPGVCGGVSTPSSQPASHTPGVHNRGAGEQV